MIVGSKTSAYPTNIVLGTSRNRVYIEVMPGDTEDYMKQAAEFIQDAMREITLLRKQKIGKKVECEPLKLTQLDKG